MKILIDIGHPGHIHLFRPFAKEMIKKGHRVLFTCRQKEFEIELLKAAGLDFVCLGKHYHSKIAKIWGLFKYDILLLQVARAFKPDLFFSHGSFYAAHVAALMKKHHIAMEDTGNKEQMCLYLPFTKAVLMPDVLKCNVGNKGIYYKGYHELAYLHPKRFTSLEKEGMDVFSEPYFIVRFVSLEATHDIGHKVLSLEDKRNIIRLLSSKGRVFISSEKKIPVEFEPYRLTIRPENLHHVLAHAYMVVSEGSTTAAEAAVLGRPVIYTSRQMENTAELGKYGLCFCFHKDSQGVIDKIEQWLAQEKLHQQMEENRVKMLMDKIDVTAFMVWFIENWPKSFEIMKKDPYYQLKFK